VEDQLGHSVELGKRLAHREHESDAVRAETASDEGEYLQGRFVKEMRVVDQAYERLVRTDFGDQSERGQAEDETVDVATRELAERGSERIALWRGESCDAIRDRRAQAVQCRIREVLLRLHATDPCDPKTGCGRHRVVEQGRLAKTRLASQHHALTVPPAGAVEDPFQGRALSGEYLRAIPSKGDVRRGSTGIELEGVEHALHGEIIREAVTVRIPWGP
jgi:hypothetical protein